MVDDLFHLKTGNVDYELNLNRKDFVEFLKNQSEYYNEAVGKIFLWI